MWFQQVSNFEFKIVSYSNLVAICRMNYRIAIMEDQNEISYIQFDERIVS